MATVHVFIKDMHGQGLEDPLNIAYSRSAQPSVKTHIKYKHECKHMVPDREFG